MKKIFTLITGSLLMLSVVGQPNEMNRKPYYAQGKLSVSSIANEPVKILIDGNNYNNKGNDVTMVNDVRPGYHAVKVYQQKKYGKNGGIRSNKNMQLIYEGNVYVKSQYHVDIVINRFGKAFIDEKQMNAAYYDDNGEDMPGGWGNNDNNFQPMNGRSFEQFKQVIRNENFDNTKLTIAKQTIAANYFSAAQVKEIVQLFSFENSKLDIAEFSYKYTIDKNNYFIMNDAFSFSGSKEELARFIKAYR